MVHIRIFDKLLSFYFYLYLSIFFTDYSFIFSFLKKRFIFPLGQISNIVGPTIIFIFLLSLRWFIDKKSFFKCPTIKRLRRISAFSEKKFLFFLILAIFLVLLALSIARHLSLSSSASDLGIFDQAIWNTAQGNLLFSSLKGNINLLGDHFEPVLIFIAPFYKLWPNVTVLFIVQSFLLASAIIPLYLIAREKLKEKFIIYTFIISYILSRPLRGVGLSDFHPESFIVPLLFWTYYFLIKGKNILLLLATFFLLLCKEDVTFLIAGFGIFAFFLQKRAKLGISLFILGVAIWLMETKFIIPYFNPQGIYPYMNRLPFGMTYVQNIQAIISNPSLLGKVIFDKEKIEYCLKLFGTLGFLSLFSPSHYILFAIPLLKNLLPTDPNFCSWYKITSHYTAAVIPFIYISAIYGAGWIIERTRHKQTNLFICTFIVLCSLFFYGKTDAYKFRRFLKTIKENRTLEKLSYLKLVPPDASVATNFNLVPHLSQRKYIFEWNPRNKRSEMTEYLVIDLNLIEYLSQEDISQIEPYLEGIQKNDYQKIFESNDKTFFIFHNLNFNQIELEKIY